MFVEDTFAVKIVLPDELSGGGGGRGRRCCIPGRLIFFFRFTFFPLQG